MTMLCKKINVYKTMLILLPAFILGIVGCSQEPAWKTANDSLAETIAVEIQDADIPETAVIGNVEPGLLGSLDTAPEITLASGVTAKVVWTRGVMVALVTMEPISEILWESIGTSERFMLMRKGLVGQMAGEDFVPMYGSVKTTTWTSTPQNDFIYLKAGSDNAVKAMEDGAEFIEVYCPPRADYIEKAGGVPPPEAENFAFTTAPTVPNNKVFNFHDLQFFSMQSQTMQSRMIGGMNMQLVFKSAEPGHETSFHNQQQDRLSLVLRGSAEDVNPLNANQLTENSFTYLPATMLHKDVTGVKGCDMLTVVWPPSRERQAAYSARMKEFHKIIPADSRVELVHDGETEEPLLNFSEGPVWIDGRLYFSNMWFAKGFAAGSPEKSNTIRMDPDGSMTVISTNMQTNGLMPLGNGNLAVCDMFGHRIVEMSPKGRVLKTLANTFEGVRVDGPNDLVVDGKGGIYFTDPQFTPGLEKKQPGRSVFYKKPNGTVIRVVEPGAIELPNGILLSPDGKTCYINNTRGNIVFAYDVNDDGTLANRHDFAILRVAPGQREQEAVITGADGMTIDENGNLYVATLMGLQIFDSTGEFIGIIHFPIRPISAAFGGDDMQTIFATCATQIYKIKTNVKGLKFPLGS